MHTLFIILAIYFGGIVFSFFFGPAIDHITNLAAERMLRPQNIPISYSPIEKCGEYVGWLVLWPIIAVVLIGMLIGISGFVVVRRIFRGMPNLLSKVDGMWARVFARSEPKVPNDPPYR